MTLFLQPYIVLIPKQLVYWFCAWVLFSSLFISAIFACRQFGLRCAGLGFAMSTDPANGYFCCKQLGQYYLLNRWRWPFGTNGQSSDALSIG